MRNDLSLPYNNKRAKPKFDTMSIRTLVVPHPLRGKVQVGGAGVEVRQLLLQQVSLELFRQGSCQQPSSLVTRRSQRRSHNRSMLLSHNRYVLHCHKWRSHNRYVHFSLSTASPYGVGKTFVQKWRSMYNHVFRQRTASPEP